MADNTYLPTANLSPLFVFEQFSQTGDTAIADFEAALVAAFPDVSIQCFADGTAGATTHALIVCNDQQVLSVAPGHFVGYNQGVWSMYTSAQVGGGISSKFTAYDAS